MATAYSDAGDMDATGLNACEFDQRKLAPRWRNKYAAMNEADWDAAGGLKVCGSCIQACGAGGCVVAMIVDLCPGWACERGNVDFSTLALSEATGYWWDKKPIKWDYVACDDEDGDRADEEPDSNGKPSPSPRRSPPSPSPAVPRDPTPQEIGFVASADEAVEAAVDELTSIGENSADILDAFNAMATP